MGLHTYRLTGSNRRHFLRALSAGGLFFTQRGAFAQALVLTPAQTEGPYYPDRLPLDQDNDLLLINDAITPAVGAPAWLSGRVLDRGGSPVRNALVEIWQADNLGSYIHSQGALNGRRDGNFQGYGRFLTASDGAYLFRTIKPGQYPGRVRHVHCKVTLPAGRTLTTQLYVEGETGSDSVLNGITNAEQRASVIRPWTQIPGSAVGALAVTWDIRMDYTPADTPASSRPSLATSGAATHGATQHPGVASGAWVSLYGSGLAATSRTWTDADLAGGRLPESLDGVSVKIGNQPAAVYYISQTQINVLAPETAVDGSVQVTVTNSGGVSDAVTVDAKRLQPGFFQYAAENVAAVRADGTPIAPAGAIDGVASAPARPGETIVLFGSGFGATNPAAPAGQMFAQPLPLAAAVNIRIDNQSTPVAFAGLISPGLYQFNVTVPDLPDGDYPVTAETGGVRTAKFAKLRIERAASASVGPRLRPSDVVRLAVA